MKTPISVVLIFIALPCILLAQQGHTAKSSTAPQTQTQDAEIRLLIEQLVLTNEPADPNELMPPLSPGVRDSSDAYRQRFERCMAAFEKLTA